MIIPKIIQHTKSYLVQNWYYLNRTPNIVQKIDQKLDYWEDLLPLDFH